VPGGDRGSHGRVGDSVRRQVGKFEEHLFQAAGHHEGEEPAAGELGEGEGAVGGLLPGRQGPRDWQLAWLMTVWRRVPG